jgi:isocitrate dehydrogenase
LATYSFLPIVQAFTATAGIEMETKDISLLPEFYPLPEFLNEDPNKDVLFGNQENQLPTTTNTYPNQFEDPWSQLKVPERNQPKANIQSLN